MRGVPCISGVIPGLAVKAAHVPARTETGIGALMPWADRLWFVTYVAHKKDTGDGTGLFYVDDNMVLHKHPASVVGTYANRMVHRETSQCIIGPHILDVEGHVRTFSDLVDIRLTGTARHLERPEEMVYFLGMEGEFYEANVHTLETRLIAELTEELHVVPGKRLAHFKDMFASHGKVFVANNSYYSKDFAGPESDGRLAEWDGRTWTVLAKTQFNTLAGRIHGELGTAVYAVGADRASVILRTYEPGCGWQVYRLPRGTHTQDHAYTTEWPRIREVESERWLVDAGGLFYEMPAMTYAQRLWGVRPVCTHLRIIADFCSWNGMLVLAGDQTTPINDANVVGGQPQANLWFGKPDDLWQWGKPSGWGGPWWDSPVRGGEPSDPYLMTGFGNACLHLSAKGAGTRVDMEVDFRGDGQFHRCGALDVAADGYAVHVFPAGFSAHWIRLVPADSALLTAQFVYT